MMKKCGQTSELYHIIAFMLVLPPLMHFLSEYIWPVMSRLDGLRRSIITGDTDVDIGDDPTTELFYRQQEIISMFRRIIEDVDGFLEADSAIKVDVLDNIYKEITKTGPAKFTLGWDVIDEACLVLARLLSARTPATVNVAIKAMQVIGRLASIHTSLFSHQGRDAFIEAVRRLLQHDDEMLQSSTMVMIGLVARVSYQNALLFRKIVDLIFARTVCIAEAFTPIVVDEKDDSYCGLEYDPKKPLEDLNPGLFAFHEIVNWLAADPGWPLRDIFQGIWKCSSRYKKIAKGIEACMRIYAKFVSADHPGTFNEFKESQVFLIASGVISCSGCVPCELAAFELVKCAHMTGGLYSEYFAHSDVPIESIIAECKCGCTKVRCEALHCLAVMVQVNSDYFINVHNAEVLVGKVRSISNLTYKETTASMCLICACVPLYPPGDIYDFDIGMFVKHSLHIIEQGDDNLTGMLIKTLHCIVSHLLLIHTNAVEDYFVPRWSESNGPGIISYVSTNYDGESVENQELASALLRFVNENIIT